MIVIVLKIKVIHLILTLLFITKVNSLTESVCSPEKDCWFLSVINYQLRVLVSNKLQTKGYEALALQQLQVCCNQYLSSPGTLGFPSCFVASQPPSSLCVAKQRVIYSN